MQKDEIPTIDLLQKCFLQEGEKGKGYKGKGTFAVPFPPPLIPRAGWFHTKKEKYISLDFSCTTIDFDPSPNLSPLASACR
ncbi:hypothetical protein NSTC731_05077 [Nostoc sp. DSM 114167]|jgi:hypothetical protein